MHHSTVAFSIFVITRNTLTSKRVTAQPLFLFLILLGKAKRAEKTYASTGASKLNASTKEKEINTQRKIVILFGTALTQKESIFRTQNILGSVAYTATRPHKIVLNRTVMAFTGMSQNISNSFTQTQWIDPHELTTPIQVPCLAKFQCLVRKVHMFKLK